MGWKREMRRGPGLSSSFDCCYCYLTSLHPRIFQLTLSSYIGTSLPSKPIIQHVFNCQSKQMTVFKHLELRLRVEKKKQEGNTRVGLTSVQINRFLGLLQVRSKEKMLGSFLTISSFSQHKCIFALLQAPYFPLKCVPCPGVGLSWL